MDRIDRSLLPWLWTIADVSGVIRFSARDPGIMIFD
jgi:hypothetical protein